MQSLRGDKNDVIFPLDPRPNAQDVIGGGAQLWRESLPNAIGLCKNVAHPKPIPDSADGSTENPPISSRIGRYPR